MFGKIKKVLGVLTDVLTFGRSKGWWNRGHGPLFEKTDFEKEVRTVED